MGRDAAAISDVIDNLRRVFQVINDSSRNAEQATGLTGPQIWVLKILAGDAPMRVSELARRMYLRPATVVGILDRLEGKGMVTRTRSQLDRRAVDLNLTDEGRALVATAPGIAQDMLVKGLDELTDEQFASVEEGMKQMAHLLGAEHLVPQPLHTESRWAKG